jgi:pilus assembly protein CpaC
MKLLFLILTYSLLNSVYAQDNSIEDAIVPATVTAPEPPAPVAAIDPATPAVSDIQIVEKPIEVQIGIDYIHKVDFDYPSGGISIGGDNISVKSDRARRELVIKGLKQGPGTSITIRDTSNDIREKLIVSVTATGKSKIVTELRELIGDVEGIEIGIKGDKVYVGGEIIVPGDIGRIGTVLSAYPETLVLVEMSPQSQRVIARKMMDELSKSGLKDVSVRVVNKAFWVEGVVSSQGKKDTAFKILKNYLPDSLQSLAQRTGGSGAKVQIRDDLVDFVSVNEKKEPQPAPKMVKIMSQFVELSKDYSKLFAFKWSPLQSDGDSSISLGQTQQGGVDARGSNSLTATISNLFPKLNSAKSAGYARVVQSGMVVVKDNTRGSITKTTAIPYTLGTGDFTRAAEANITFDLGVTPQILEQEKIDLNTSVTVTIPAGTGANGVPSTTKNTLTAQVIVKSKESAVIGGVVQNTSSTAYDKDDPAPAKDPVQPLFRLIRSKNYRVGKSQFVIFITPEIIDSAASGSEEIRKKFRRRDK